LGEGDPAELRAKETADLMREERQTEHDEAAEDCHRLLAVARLAPAFAGICLPPANEPKVDVRLGP
jgi:hypothetical protein